jgi:putative FmdB family regulatory protein
MPIYAYRCEACGHELDALQKISDAPLTDCPECGAAALVKQITAAAFRLKGSGWYETDFKKDNQKNLHKDAEPAKDKGKEKGKEGGESKSTESAPGKTETKTAKPAEKKAVKPKSTPAAT